MNRTVKNVIFHQNLIKAKLKLRTTFQQLHSLVVRGFSLANIEIPVHLIKQCYKIRHKNHPLLKYIAEYY
ncbi:MAG: hypothetical protein A2Z59_01705 [Nitrospinae bacterium RIFCSPLOWO2_02_39_17]|nr:MAG: hypothetical protein A2Z59_01705 [Nitrospinae bacterium RIFCSPLOWO2_02_39_17]OGW11025.1 MAG: hypothetical protein A2W75_08700 [Nitrospinae bacterium RIFCSPLOWO2_12_39_15]